MAGRQEQMQDVMGRQCWWGLNRIYDLGSETKEWTSPTQRVSPQNIKKVRKKAQSPLTST